VNRSPEPADLLAAFERTGDGVYAVDFDQNIVFWKRNRGAPAWPQSLRRNGT
jgi:hypothetical protein